MLKEYTIVLKKSSGQVVSLCLENMVVGCGKTKNEAIENIKEAILSYMDSMEEGMSLERPVPLDLLQEVDQVVGTSRSCFRQRRQRGSCHLQERSKGQGSESTCITEQKRATS